MPSITYRQPTPNRAAKRRIIATLEKYALEEEVEGWIREHSLDPRPQLDTANYDETSTGLNVWRGDFGGP
jgi:hypothetical protein